MVEIITSFENEEKNTIDYLKIKKKYIEEKVLEKNQVRINEK